MTEDLTSSHIARQNILNNKYAIEHIESNLALGGIGWKNETVFTKAQVSEILAIDERTVDRYIEQCGEELSKNGYKVIKGKELKGLKENFGDDMNVATKTTILGLFTFRAVLNIAMLVTESEKAKAIRSKILDIVIDVVAKKAGGHTKYINQRDENYLPAAYQEFSYRRGFTDILRDYLEMGNHKYALYTDKIYQIVFLEKATEYKKILKLAEKDNLRDTMYAEVLRVIASFEHGLSEELKKESIAKKRKLYPKEFDNIIENAAESPYHKPHIDDARAKMASRDLCFRDTLHQKLESYIQSVPQSDFDKFLGETSKSLEERLSDPETLAVLKRLKDR